MKIQDNRVAKDILECFSLGYKNNVKLSNNKYFKNNFEINIWKNWFLNKKPEYIIYNDLFIFNSADMNIIWEYKMN